MPTTSPTNSGPAKLSDLARHVVLPSGITSSGWPAVRHKCAELGVTFDDWQDGAGRAILAKRADGLYACSIGGVVFSIPRQVGKTFLIGAIIFALCLLNPGTTVLWTAHRLRTADETFAKMQAFAGRKKVKPHVSGIRLGSGDQEVKFRNGSRILFGARERGFGRGFDDVDIEVFDEAQILTENAIDDMIPATNTATNPLLFFIGTPPKPSDPCQVFTAKRTEALSGESDDTVYIEFSADPDCSPVDRKQWKKANPSYPGRTPTAAMMRMKKNLTPSSWMREALGVWDPKDDGRPINVSQWSHLLDVDSFPTDDTRRICLTAPQHLTTAMFVEAGKREDGLFHVGVRRDVPIGDMGELVDLAKKLNDLHGCPIIIPPGDPVLAFKVELVGAGVVIDEMKPAEFAQGCGYVKSKVENGTLRHRGQRPITEAVEHLVTKKAGQVDVWNPRGSDVDTSPFVAATCALVRVPDRPRSEMATEPMFAVT